MTDAPASVHLLSGDLFFHARVEATARAVGVPLAIARSAAEVAERLDAGPDGATVLVDLGAAGPDPAAAIAELKARPSPPVVVAFGPHREVELFAAARAAGADRVLARSAFSERLAEILRAAGAGAG